jgi:hypothetical protein
VIFNSGETYYLVFMDDQGRETPVGRYNISSVMKQNPKYEVSIKHVVRCECVQEQCCSRIWCPYHHTWHEVPQAAPRHVYDEGDVIQWLSQ